MGYYTGVENEGTTATDIGESQKHKLSKIRKSQKNIFSIISNLVKRS